MVDGMSVCVSKEFDEKEDMDDIRELVKYLRSQG